MDAGLILPLHTHTTRAHTCIHTHVFLAKQLLLTRISDISMGTKVIQNALPWSCWPLHLWDRPGCHGCHGPSRPPGDTASWWSATVNWHSQVFFCQAPFQPLCPESVALQGIVVTQVKVLVLSLFEDSCNWPWPLNPACSDSSAESPTFQQMNIPTQLGVICEFTESALNLLIQIIAKHIKQALELRPWRTSFVTDHQLDLTPFTTTLWAHPASQNIHPIKDEHSPFFAHLFIKTFLIVFYGSNHIKF